MLRHEKASQTNIVILKWGRIHTIRRNSMPFIVYFFLSLLVIYIPLPTFFLLVNRLAEQHDAITALTKLCLLLFVCLDYFTSYYWLKQTRVKKRYYFLFLPCLFQSLWVSDPLLFTSSVSYDSFVDHLGLSSGRTILYVHLPSLKKI